jgi:hypothetical protein
MPAVPDVSEVWAALVTNWRADAGLVALLSSNTAIYRGQPEKQLVLPAMVIDWRHLRPTDSTASGLYTPDVQINVFATDQDVGGKVYAHLEQNWQIPTQRAAQIATANFRVTSMRYLNPIQIGPVRMANYAQEVWHTVVEARLRISRLKAS